MADNAAALARLHDAHAGPLWRYVTKLTGNANDTDDVVQETLLRAWQHPRLLDEPVDEVRGWLFTVARHIVIDRVRSARHRYEDVSDTVPERLVDDQTDQLFDAIVLREALASLSDHHRDVIVRAYYGGASTHDVAQALGIAEGTVKSRLHYGVRALRLALQEMGVTR